MHFEIKEYTLSLSHIYRKYRMIYFLTCPNIYEKLRKLKNY